MDKEKRVKPIVYPYTLKALLYSLFYAILYFLSEGISTVLRIPNVQDIRAMFILLIIVAFIVSIPRFIHILKMLFVYRSLEKYMKTIGEIIYETLYVLDYVQTEPKDVLIDVSEIDGILICKIRGGKMYEKNLMMNAWSELLNPIENPRYILKREPQTILGFKQKADYLAVPTEIGKRKEDAELFCEKLNKKIEEASVHYTRTPEGRGILIKARIDSMVMNFVDKSERISVWK